MVRPVTVSIGQSHPATSLSADDVSLSGSTDLSLTVANGLPNEVRGVEIELRSDDVSLMEDRHVVSSLKPGNEAVVDVPVRNVSTGTKTVEADITYLTADGESRTVSRTPLGHRRGRRAAGRNRRHRQARHPGGPGSGRPREREQRQGDQRLQREGGRPGRRPRRAGPGPGLVLRRRGGGERLLLLRGPRPPDRGDQRDGDDSAPAQLHRRRRPGDANGRRRVHAADDPGPVGPARLRHTKLPARSAASPSWPSSVASAGGGTGR